MRTGKLAIAFAVLLGAGSWFGQRERQALDAIAQEGETGRRVLYYQHPDGRPDYAPAPRKDESGRDYVPVYDDAGAVDAQEPRRGRGRILYYRNPMGLADTSPVPKKDSMGMDYIAVHEDDAAESGMVRISPDRVQRLGVRTELATRRTLTRAVRAVGAVQLDERSQAVVTARFEGWIERLHVNTTGQPVRRGQVLMELFSPEVAQIEQEYVAWAGGTRDLAGAGAETRAIARRLADGALTRLRNLGVPAGEIARLQREGRANRLVSIDAPADGTVIEKKVVTGMRVGVGETLYLMADLTTVWLVADVFEQDLGLVAAGQTARILVDGHPGRVFGGEITFIYPTINRDTRTGKIRLEIPNRDLALKTDMFARVEIAAAVGGPDALVVPDTAVLDSGTRQVVLLDRGEGRFEPRSVKLGAHADGFHEVVDGLAEGDRVVVGANFLIDAESNLRAALRAFTAQEKPQ